MHIIIHRFKRFRELGIHNGMRILCNKIRNARFYWRFKRQALAGKAHHSWGDITKKDGVDFPTFWQQCISKSLPVSDYQSNIIMAQANAYTQNIFDILGSGPISCPHLPWHEDIRLKAQDPQSDFTFDSTSFYKDTRVETGLSNRIIKDIKISWELSRCQHLPILGQAYGATNDQKYAQTFTAHIQDWLDKNPYLIGINWVCPMEVAIRAINWIWAYDYFKHSPHVSMQFWERLASSLYDHMHYLEHNWEIFDTKTSNHYLSDLLGYLYLCWFFQDLEGIQKKRDWCIKELLKEFDRQVFEEGTDYESTTAYHCLVTEMFDHMAMLCKLMNIALPDTFHEKLARMHKFIEWCTINETDMVKIGDDDSGKITPVHSLPSLKARISEGWEKHFPAFGLSIIKTNPWHITLRHLAYQKKQPTAHFHNDVLSITLAINGIPVIIDPGSYLYTASSMWRNYFRSVAVHNTFYVDGHEPVPFDDRLFALNISAKAGNQDFCSSHTLYSRFDLKLARNLTWNNQEIIVTDSWNKPNQDVKLAWNFTLHPAIEVKKDNNEWIFMHQGKPLLAMQSALEFSPYQAWVSPEYGIKIPSIGLRSHCSSLMGNESKIVFIKL